MNCMMPEFGHAVISIARITRLSNAICATVNGIHLAG
jgi:hypothetical protein